jgi:glycosyltransferase involved in cell wall biosynthesis
VRRKHQLTLIEHNYPVIFSSKDAQQNFYEIYPDAQNPTYVVNFATTHLPYQHLDIEELRAKYGVCKRYIISPNQFWKHKNHQIILDAMLALRNMQEIDFQIVFTGKEYDFRYPDYAENLKKFVQENQLQNHIKFLGFIDRQDQLQLMNNALAVVQPSLFEGWSTVVEDAKAMNQYIIASSILVHQEQLEAYPNKTFFQPTDILSLVKVFQNLPAELLKQPYHYVENVQKFALDFLKIVQKG